MDWTRSLGSIRSHKTDYHIWEATKVFRPKLVLIEFNPTASNRLDYVQPADANTNRSSSPAALVRLGRTKGYELICVIGPNLFFVDAKYYSLFDIPDNSLAVMRDEDEVTSLYLGFDGSLMLDGPAEMRWHGGKVRVPQPLPRMARHYPPNYTRVQALAFRVHRLLQRLSGK